MQIGKLIALTRALLAFVLPLIAVEAHATAQRAEIIIIEGQAEALFSTPLSSYLAEHPDALPMPKEEYILSSGNWRGYVGTWEISRKKLYLRKIEDPNNFDPPDITKKVFPNQSDIFASWYSGALIIPRGRMTQYVHLGFGSTFEKYLIIFVRKGIIYDKKRFTAKEYRSFVDLKFEKYRNTRQYKKRHANLKLKLPSESNNFIEWTIYSDDLGYYLTL